MGILSINIINIINCKESDFYDQYRNIMTRYKRTGYNRNLMRQSASLEASTNTSNHRLQ